MLSNVLYYCFFMNDEYLLNFFAYSRYLFFFQVLGS